ncbi:zinc finger BED domain-containing protein RICESLEEPER 2-like isoform X1 [Nicotiana tomentosiformis]|uniref:zinc finger BED domain-containing protein RICESLEEPER 2-like isoform X1 n=1 Tax=Nicotiana tomentosiformis TaxID=4098 RepID=UPI00388C9D0F
MAENIQSHKVMGESGASNSNAISQSETTESNITKKGKKGLLCGIILQKLLLLKGLQRQNVTIALLSILLKPKTQLIENEDTVLSEMAKKMKEKFDKYWGDPGKMNNIIFISCILDPRYKLESVGYALVKMFGQDPGAIIQAEVKKYMTSLFSEYVKSVSKGVVLDSSSDCSSLDTSTSRLSESQVSTQNTGLLESLMQDIKKYKSGSGGVDTRTELDKYFGEETEDDTKEFDVLLWWKLNSARFPILAEMARDVLAVPVSSVASECAFSTGGRILDSFRSSLTPKLVQALVCLQDWLRNEKLKQPVCVEEDLDKIEQLEQGLERRRAILLVVKFLWLLC